MNAATGSAVLPLAVSWFPVQPGVQREEGEDGTCEIASGCEGQTKGSGTMLHSSE